MYLSNFAPPPPMRARDGNRRGFDLQRNLCPLGLGKIIFLIPSLPHQEPRGSMSFIGDAIFSRFPWLSPSFSRIGGGGAKL